MPWKKRDGAPGPRDEVMAFLGQGTEFEGKLIFDGTVRIDGKFSGEIFTKGNLIFGESSQVRAEIETNQAIISGEINGNISAESRVEIHSPGKVYGNIKSPVLVIEEGVVFEGNCQMEKQGEQKIFSVVDVKEKESDLAGVGDDLS